MDERLAKELVKTRKAVRQKYRALKTESTQSQLQLEKGYKPITEPLQKLLENFKSEVPIKKELDWSNFIKVKPPNESAISSISTPRKQEPINVIQRYLPTHGVTFLEDKFLEADSIHSDPEPENEDEAIEAEVERSRRILNDESKLEGYDEYLEAYDELPRYFVDASIRDLEDNFDHQHGLKHDADTDKFTIGDSFLEIVGKDVKVHNITYPGTVGLYELLFKKNPKSYNNTDLDNYMDILKRTNTYRKNYKSDEQIQGTQSLKYLDIIKPYLQKKGILKAPSNTSTTGIIRTSSFSKPKAPATRQRTQSHGNMKKGGMLHLSNKPIDYIYYDDPNELVDRLKLLVASQLAGHTGHGNEIISIEEELREAKIIR